VLSPRVCFAVCRCWPSLSMWDDFNNSIGGRLLSPFPTLYSCHNPHYDIRSCNEAMTSYYDGYWRSAQPVTMQLGSCEEAINNSTSCLGFDRKSPCYRGEIPYYVVNATNVIHVTQAVMFAAKNNIRLVIKNTGHCYIGRSTAKDALSIWTHHLKQVNFINAFIPDGDGHGNAVPAVSVGAGVQWFELYAACDTKGVVVVGGDCATVGAAGGYIQGAGHSPIGRQYGLAVDNVLQYKIVTADGVLRTANAFQNTDLFWALRGGGGGTWGVVVEVTSKTYPAFSNMIFAPYTFYADDEYSFKDLLKMFLSIQPYWADMGLTCYASINYHNLVLIAMKPNITVPEARTLMDKFLNVVLQMQGVTYSGGVLSYSSFWSMFSDQLLQEPAGAGEYISSRLIPRTIFEDGDSASKLTDILYDIMIANYLSLGEAEITILGTAGGTVAANAGIDASVNPAWRKALWHLVIGLGVADNATASEKATLLKSLSLRMQMIRDITPGSGAYVNEPDWNEPNWQQSFFGDSYPELRKIKDVYDPQGLFVCRQCVGSEDWSGDLNCHV